MSNISREAQRAILSKLAEAYPGTRTTLNLTRGFPGAVVLANIAYLEEHDLLRGLNDASGLMAGPHWKITAKGLDFLEDDGGLSAILNVTTVRLEADTLKALISAHIDELPAPAEEKSRMKEAIKDISADALKDLAKSLIAQAMKHGPQAYEALRGIASSLS